MNKKVIRATKWSFITEIIAKLIAPFVNMILARLLTPEAFGSVATITMIISFAEIFTDAGFQKYIVQHEFKDDDDFNLGVNVAFWSNFCLSLIAVLCIGVFKNQISNIVGEPALSNGIAVASVSIILVSFSSIQMAVYRRKFDFKTLFYVRIVVSLIPLIITVPLAFAFRNYWALIIGTIVSNIAQSVILTCKSTWKPQFKYSFKKFKEMFSFTSWTLLESITIWLTGYIGIFIVGRILNTYYLGLYKTAMTTVNAYMGIITSAVIPVLFSALSRCQDDEESYLRTFNEFQSAIGIFVIPMGVGIYVYRNLITNILLGSNWLNISDFMGLWGLVSAFAIVFSHLYSEVFRSKGRPDISLLSQFIHLCFLIPAIIISVNLSFEIFCTTRALIRFQIIFVNMLLAHYIFKIKIYETLKNVLPQFIAAALMGLAGYAMVSLSDNIIWQFSSVFICIVIYFTILLLFPGTRKKILSVEFVRKFTKSKNLSEK